MTDWLERLKRALHGARAYRFDGEQRILQEQLRETQVSLSMMAGATEDPDHIRMASDIEHGAEARLGVLLGKPLLTLEEKRERDAIQAALAVRRQGFGGAPEPMARRSFLPALPAVPGALALLMTPWTLVALLAAWSLVQMGLKERVENQRDEARADLAQAARHLAAAQTERDLLAERALAADAQSQATAANIEAERARRLRTERELRRVRDAMAQASSDVPIDYGFGSVRDSGPATPSPGDRAGADTGNPR